MDCHTLLQCPYPLPTPAKQRKRGEERREEKTRENREGKKGRKINLRKKV